MKPPAPPCLFKSAAACRAVDSHVKNMRRKLLAIAPSFDGLSSVYGVGYRFDAPV